MCEVYGNEKRYLEFFRSGRDWTLHIKQNIGFRFSHCLLFCHGYCTVIEVVPATLMGGISCVVTRANADQKKKKIIDYFVTYITSKVGRYTNTNSQLTLSHDGQQQLLNHKDNFLGPYFLAVAKKSKKKKIIHTISYIKK